MLGTDPAQPLEVGSGLTLTGGTMEPRCLTKGHETISGPRIKHQKLFPCPVGNLKLATQTEYEEAETQTEICT